MFFASIIQDYFVWHYTRAWWQMWGIWRNMLWFTVHFFSMPQLARSWFAPFKRMTEGRGERLNFEDLATYIIINLISRIIGSIARTVLLAFGLAALILTIIGGFIVYTLWLVIPVVIIGMLGMSVSLFLI